MRKRKPDHGRRCARGSRNAPGPRPRHSGCSTSRLAATPWSWLTNSPWALLTASPGRPPGVEGVRLAGQPPARRHHHRRGGPRAAASGDGASARRDSSACGLHPSAPHGFPSPDPSLPTGEQRLRGNQQQNHRGNEPGFRTPRTRWGAGHLARGCCPQGASPPGVLARGAHWLSKSSRLVSACWRGAGVCRNTSACAPAGGRAAENTWLRVRGPPGGSWEHEGRNANSLGQTG